MSFGCLRPKASIHRAREYIQQCRSRVTVRAPFRRGCDAGSGRPLAPLWRDVYIRK